MDRHEKHPLPLTPQILQEFFKVFMPNTSSTHLRIPQAFTEFFNGTAPSEVTLVDHFGKCWDIGLEKSKDGLVLTNGWQHFVTDKCLVEADFLIFEYDGDSTFYVKIFSKSGIRKEPPNLGNLVPIVTLDEDDSDQSCRKMQRGLKRKHSPTILKIKEKSDSEEGALLSEGSRVKMKRATSERNENDEKNAVAAAPAKRVPMKNPHFVIPFSGWRLTSYTLELPKLVMMKLNMRVKSMINLRDENDKVWPVMIRWSPSKGGRTFLSKGWSDFRKAKNIKEGQICAFKFVIGSHNVAHELLVRLRRPPSKSR